MITPIDAHRRASATLMGAVLMTKQLLGTKGVLNHE